MCVYLLVLGRREESRCRGVERRWTFTPKHKEPKSHLLSHSLLILVSISPFRNDIFLHCIDNQITPRENNSKKNNNHNLKEKRGQVHFENRDEKERVRYDLGMMQQQQSNSMESHHFVCWGSTTTFRPLFASPVCPKRCDCNLI